MLIFLVCLVDFAAVYTTAMTANSLLVAILVAFAIIFSTVVSGKYSE
jgi:hypothetical protein